MKFRSPVTFKTQSPDVIPIPGSTNVFFAKLPQEIADLFNSNLIRLDCKTVQGQTNAFAKCAPVAAIIGKIAELTMNGKYIFVDANGKEVRANNPLSKIIYKPNLMQTWGEFISAAASFIKLHGQCYILPIIPAPEKFYKIKDASSLYVVPNWMVTPMYTGRAYFQTKITDVISGYQISGFDKTIPADQMIVIRDSSPTINMDTGRMFEGQSRLYSMSDQVNNCIAIQDALYTLTTKRGALGAWVNDNGGKDGSGKPFLLPTEKDEITKEFGSFGVNSNKIAPYMVLRQSVKWVQAAMDVTALKLFEGNESAVTAFAMGYNVPMYLLGLKDSTFTNLETAGRHIYSNVVIPLVENIVSSLCSAFEIDNNQLLTVCFDHLDIFQKSKLDEATALNQLAQALGVPFDRNILTREEFRAILANYMPDGTPFDAAKISGKTFLNTLTNGNGQGQA